jgi:hypothetical protein
MASDGCASPKENRAHFMPIVPAPFAQGKFMTVLEANGPRWLRLSEGESRSFYADCARALCSEQVYDGAGAIDIAGGGRSPFSIQGHQLVGGNER